jgi:RNA polymerase sigma factor (sigma-70 family)
VDPKLVVAAQHGDALALDQLLDELAPYVRRLCAGIAPHAVDDATQEALLAIFQDLRSLRAPAAIMTWARAVTVRTATRLDRRARQDQERQASAALETGAGTGPEAGSEVLAQPHAPSREPEGESLVAIGDILARLPATQRAVLVLRILEGLSDQEIADALGVPVGTVKSRLHRARAAFRKGWEAWP